jgi:hypothetical protein
MFINLKFKFELRKEDKEKLIKLKGKDEPFRHQKVPLPS